MTLQELRFIVALAREKHFGKAAQLAHVSQPTLSIAINKLERELGVMIFERNKNDVSITPVGKDVIERAKKILSDIDDIKQITQIDKNHLKGTFKLGVIYTIGPYLLPALITELNQLAPEMSIEIREDYTANLKEKLSTGELDAIVISLPFKATGIVTKILYKEPFVVLMPSDHALSKLKAVSEKVLSTQNVLLLGEGHCFRDQIISSCPTCFMHKAKSGVSWRTVDGSSLETIRHMVAAKMGLTILPLTAANIGPYKEGFLTSRPLRSVHAPGRTVALAWRKSYTRPKAIDALLEAVLRCDLIGSVK